MLSVIIKIIISLFLAGNTFIAWVLCKACSIAEEMEEEVFEQLKSRQRAYKN